VWYNFCFEVLIGIKIIFPIFFFYLELFLKIIPEIRSMLELSGVSQQNTWAFRVKNKRAQYNTIEISIVYITKEFIVFEKKVVD